MSKYTLYLIFMMLWLSSCEPYTPIEEPLGNEPVFTSIGQFNGEEKSFVADGVNAIASSSSFEDSLGVVIHEGFLHDADNDLNRFIEIQLRSSSSTNTSVESVLNQTNIPIRYVSGLVSKLYYNISLSGDFIGNPTSVVWTILGETYSGNALEFKVAADESISKIPVSISASYSSGCDTSFTDTIYLPNHKCDGSISAIQQDINTFEYTISTNEGSGFKYSWEFSDGSRASAKTVKRFYSDPIADKEVALLRIENEFGTAYKRFAFDLNGSADCDLNTSYTITPTYEFSAQNVEADYGQVVMNFYDNGIRYSSENILQPEGSALEIIDYNEYLDAASPGRTFVKVKMLFNGLLVNDSNSISVQNLELVLPFEL